MGRLTPDEFRKKYAELPPNLREAYGSIKTTEILEEIGKKHGLHIDKIGELVDETGYVMLGVTPPDEFIAKLEGAAGIDRMKAKEIAFDVNEQVFKPIRDALKRVHRVGEYKDNSLQKPKIQEPESPTHIPVAAPPPPFQKPSPLSQPAHTPPLPRETPTPLTPQYHKEEPKQVRTMTEDMKNMGKGAEEQHGATSFTASPAESPKSPALLPPENLSEERLTKTFSLPPQESNYTISKNGKEEHYSLDPYREPTE